MEGDGYARPHQHSQYQQAPPMQQPPPYHGQYHQAPPMPQGGGGGGMYYPPPPEPRHGFDSRGPPYGGEPDYRGRPRSESRGRDMRGGYDRFRGRGPGGNRSRSRSPPRGGGDAPRAMPRQHRASGEWERYDEPAPPKERKATQAIEPMDSYKVFMMRQDENATPETYQQRYEEYKKKYVQRLMRAFFEDHKKEEWLQERYSPAIRFRLDVQKRAKKITEAKNFGERVRNGTATICLDENAELPGRDFDNDLEDSARILYIRRIPCACPVSSLSESILGESIKKAGGNFQQIYLSDPVKKSAFDFDRTAYIVYDTPEAAAEALPKIHNTFVQDADTFAPFRLQVSQHRSRAPLKTPSYLSVPERLAFDFAQARTLAAALDRGIFAKDADLKRFGIDALLAHDDVARTYASAKQQLDVVVAYLRRVHHYIYYAGTQCLDMGDIMHAHPALFCRPEPTARDLEEARARLESVDGAAEGGANEDTATADATATSAGDDQAGALTTTTAAKALGGWAASLDEKVQAYIASLEPSAVAAVKSKEQALVSEIEAREEAALESTYANYCEKAGDDGKHRCRLCTKLFKAADFVKKHIRNKHPELVVDKIADVGESYMWEQYREDPNRPLPPVETTNTLTNPVLGGGRAGGGGASGSFQSRGSGPRGGLYNNNHNNGGGGPPRSYRNDGPPGGGGYRGRGASRDRGGPPPPRRDSFGPPPPRQSRGPPPDSDLPVDPRQVSKSYQDLDNLQDTKVELSFDALDSLPPPKKKTKV